MHEMQGIETPTPCRNFLERILAFESAGEEFRKSPCVAFRHLPPDQLGRTKAKAIHVSIDRWNGQTDSTAKKSCLPQQTGGSLPTAEGRCDDRKLMRVRKSFGCGKHGHSFSMQRRCQGF